MAEPGDPLSERELDVVALVAQGAANREIAKRLSISPNTVKVHLRNVYTKLGVTSRAECTAVAIQRGFVTLPGAVPAGEPAARETAPEQDAAPPAGDAAPPAPIPVPPAERRRWRMLTLLLGLVAVAAIILLWRAVGGDSSPATAPVAEAPLESNWFSAAPLPAPRAAAAVAATGLDAFLIGGQAADGSPTPSVFVFASAAGAWRSGAAKPTPTYDAPAAVLFGEIYVPGGRTGEDTLTNQVEVYSPANDAWRSAAALPLPLTGSTAVSDGSFLYVFGGETGDGVSAAAFVYDPGTNSWRPLPPLPTPRRDAAAGIIAGQLYVVGGSSAGVPLAACAVFSPLDESWSECPPLLTPRAGAAGATLYNRLYLFGGGGGDGDAPPYAEFFDPDTATWQVVNVPGDTIDTAWHDAGVAIVERKIYLFGGRNGETPVDSNLVYVPFPYQTFIPSAPGQ